jgi:hypothetical protein
MSFSEEHAACINPEDEVAHPIETSIYISKAARVAIRKTAV